MKPADTRLRSILARTLITLALLTTIRAPATAQLSGKSVSEDAGPVSDGSRSVSHGSRPVHERGRSTHESSVGSLSGNSTYESSSGPVTSGSFAEITAGSVTSDRSLRREKAEARLAPAPPRIMRQETFDAPVEWERVYDLEPLVDDVSAIEPMARAELTDAEDEESPVESSDFITVE